jgi:zinc protease
LNRTARAALAAGGLLALWDAAAAAPVAVAGYTYVRSLGGIDEYHLDSNGLDVLLKPEHSAPVVSFNVTYHVGSRNEVTGTTGSTHLLEHMMFKGSEHFNKDAGNGIDVVLERVGGSFNATTGEDRTHYFATVGRDSLESYIAVESDRMRNLWLHESDRQSEMTVVRNEYERGENDPAGALYKEVVATAYQAQPYHHPTIGWRSDIEGVPIEKLREFYDTFYWPDNATAILVGDFEPAHGLELIKRYYGSIPHSPKPIPAIYTKEPPQQGPRRVIVKRAGALGNVTIAYKGPDARDADLPPLTVLGAILGTGKNSRLSHALLDKSLVTKVEASVDPMHDPGPFIISATVAPNVTHQSVEDAVLAEIARIKQQGVSAEEVTRAVTQYRTDVAYNRDGTMSVVWSLNEWVAAGDWTLYIDFPNKIAKVTAADVQRVAKTYLDEDQSTTGWFIPVVTP